jgi:hypothetical protein
MTQANISSFASIEKVMNASGGMSRVGVPVGGAGGKIERVSTGGTVAFGSCSCEIGVLARRVCANVGIGVGVLPGRIVAVCVGVASGVSSPATGLARRDSWVNPTETSPNRATASAISANASGKRVLPILWAIVCGSRGMSSMDTPSGWGGSISGET